MFTLWINLTVINFILLLLVYLYKPDIVRYFVVGFYSIFIYLVHLSFSIILIFMYNSVVLFLIFINIVYIILLYDFKAFIRSRINLSNKKEIDKVINSLRMRDIIGYVFFGILYINFLVTLILY